MGMEALHTHPRATDAARRAGPGVRGRDGGITLGGIRVVGGLERRRIDGGFGASILSRQIGQKRAKEVWFLCRQYDAKTALDWGLVNTVVPVDRLEDETVAWCHRMLELSPFALRLLKASFNADEDGLAGIQQLAHDANLLFYGSEEAREGRDAYKEKRKPDFSRFPHRA